MVDLLQMVQENDDEGTIQTTGTLSTEDMKDPGDVECGMDDLILQACKSVGHRVRQVQEEAYDKAVKEAVDKEIEQEMRRLELTEEVEYGTAWTEEEFEADERMN